MSTSRLRHLQPRGHTAVLLAVCLLGGCGSRSDPLEPVYCYRTLADVVCYDEMDEGRERQLVGIYLRPSWDPADRRHLLLHQP